MEQATQEPVLLPVDVDMTNTGERKISPQGAKVYTLFLAQLGAGVATFEIKVNGQWIPIIEGDTVFFGDCTPVVIDGILVRSSPALPAIFSKVILGCTPDTRLERA